MFADYEPPRIRLREWRTVKNITACELAKAVGMNPATIWRLENGYHKRARTTTAKRLADALGISVFDLYRDPLKDA